MTLIGVSALVFFITYIIPGDPARVVGGPEASIETIQSIRHQLGLDQPVHIQYLQFLNRLVHGDLGQSWRLKQDVSTIILDRLPATAQLALAGLFMELVIGLSLGTLSALNQYRLIDRLAMAGAFLFLSVPGFWLGLILLYFFGFKIRLFPLGGYNGLEHLILPSLTVGLMYSPWYARMFRSALMEAYKADYLITARAKGLPERHILLRHVLPNAIKPVITMAGMDIASFMGGLVVIEIVFGWPGIGLQTWNAIRLMDIPVIMGVVLFASLLVVTMNLIVDMSYALVDPRVVYD